jgi:hypothetical protein
VITCSWIKSVKAETKAERPPAGTGTAPDPSGSSAYVCNTRKDV